jgi:hypothetical protein
VKSRKPSRLPKRLLAFREPNIELWLRSWKNEYIRIRNTVATRPRPTASHALGSMIPAVTQTPR